MIGDNKTEGLLSGSWMIAVSASSRDVLSTLRRKGVIYLSSGTILMLLSMLLGHEWLVQHIAPLTLPLH
jgi:hypothetical protein